MCSDKIPTEKPTCQEIHTGFVHNVKFSLEGSKEDAKVLEDLLSGTFILRIGDQEIPVKGEFIYGDYIQSLKEQAKLHPGNSFNDAP